MRHAAALLLAMLAAAQAALAQVRLTDASDRAAFTAWFVVLADAQFYRPTGDVTDCASLVRHAAREALRAHTEEWLRAAALPVTPALPDVRRPPRATAGGWALFAVGGGRRAEFADARTIVALNARALGRDTAGLAPGDLLYFSQAEGRHPDHLMIFVGESLVDRSAADWVVYHTGPDGGGPGEVRKVRLVDLARHPSPRWRPVRSNAAFRGVFRLPLP